MLSLSFLFSATGITALISEVMTWAIVLGQVKCQARRVAQSKCSVKCSQSPPPSRHACTCVLLSLNVAGGVVFLSSPMLQCRCLATVAIFLYSTLETSLSTGNRLALDAKPVLSEQKATNARALGETASLPEQEDLAPELPRVLKDEGD